VRDLRHLLEIFTQVLPVLADLIEALCFEEHAGIGSGEPDDGECAHQGCGNESICIAKRERNFANLPVVIPCNKKNVIAFA
jgi:hypothetical protein